MTEINAQMPGSKKESDEVCPDKDPYSSALRGT